MPLANPVVARLAAGEPIEGEYCGLLLVCADACSGASPRPHQEKMAALRVALIEAGMPASAYVYPQLTVHCTVATLRPFTAGPLSGGTRVAEADRWSAVLAAARAAPAWPTSPFDLRMGPPQLEGAAGIVKYEDSSGGIEAMRRCLREAIIAAGGLPAEGGADRSHAKPLPASPPNEPPAHIPDIVHSTVLRWAAEPTEAELAAAHAAVDRVAASWEPLDVPITRCSAVFEARPFMHVPTSGSAGFDHDGQIFWQGAVGAPLSVPRAKQAPG